MKLSLPISAARPAKAGSGLPGSGLRIRRSLRRQLFEVCFLGCLGLGLALPAFAQPGAPQATPLTATNATGKAATKSRSPIDLVLYARLLETHTRESADIVGTRVDYAGIRGDADWRSLVRQVRGARPSRLDAAGQMAFWINAYNILTLDLVAQHYPIEGIKDIGSFFSPVWDVEVARIEGRAQTLGSIEHGILRPLGDPRIHAAIVCASVSCPPLARRPFRPDRLDADLSAAMRVWLANPEKGLRIDRPARVITLSKIFSWFKSDFAKSGGVLATIAPFVSEDDAAWILGEGRRARIRHFSYDWSLNGLATDR